MSAKVGEGIANALKAATDQAVTNEWTEDNGVAKVVKCWGSKGLYIASDDSGQWVSAGPFPLAE